MKIKAAHQIYLELINESHAIPIFNMVDQNRSFLRPWLSFVDKMDTVTFAEHFVHGTIERNQDGQEYAFVLTQNGEAMGRIGIYKIDRQNKIGEIGYWLVEKAQGNGIVTSACKALISFCFLDLLLNRIEIKCGTENYKSQAIPGKLGFKKEGIIRDGEWLHDQFIDLNLYSLLKSEFLTP